MGGQKTNLAVAVNRTGEFYVKIRHPKNYLGLTFHATLMYVNNNLILKALNQTSKFPSGLQRAG